MQQKFFNAGLGYDPYNTTNAVLQAKLTVRNFHGPLTAVAYRSQRKWDFLPGLSTAEKIKHWGKV